MKTYHAVVYRVVSESRTEPVSQSVTACDTDIDIDRVIGDTVR